MDDVPSGARVVSGLWVEAMKTPTQWKAKWTLRGCEEPHSDEGCLRNHGHNPGCADMRYQEYEAFVGDYTQTFLIAEVRHGEQLFAQPPDGWKPRHLPNGRQVVWKVRRALPGLRTSLRRWQEYFTNKLK